MAFLPYTYITVFICSYPIKNFYVFPYIKHITMMLFVVSMFYGCQLHPPMQPASEVRWCMENGASIASFCSQAFLLSRGKLSVGFLAFFLHCCPMDDCSRTRTRYTSDLSMGTDTEDTTITSLQVSPKGFPYKMHTAMILTAACNCSYSPLVPLLFLPCF